MTFSGESYEGSAQPAGIERIGHQFLQNLAHSTWIQGGSMSDWDFLYEMNERGYSPEEIANAAGSGAAPCLGVGIHQQGVG